MKGYLFTALTTLMLLSLFMVTYYFFWKSTLTSGADISAQKAASIFDDVGYSLTNLAGLSCDVNNSDLTVYTFHDRVPASEDVPSRVRNYSDFLKTTYSAESNAIISPDFAALSSSTSSVEYIIYPHEFAWGYNNLSKRTLWFGNRSRESEPQALTVTLDFSAEGVEDILWLEAENFTIEDPIVAQDESASAGYYALDFTGMNTTAYVPFALNYTLWVRTAYDDATRAFKVEVDGKNSSVFNIRNPGAPSGEYKWFNDSLIIFNMTPGDKSIRVYPEPASGTEALDVVLLSTRGIDPPNEPPISRPHDPANVKRTLGGNLTFDLNVLFANVNYTYATTELSRIGESQWNFTFNDGDDIALSAGGAPTPGRGYSSLSLSLTDSLNGSSGAINASAAFPKAQDGAYVDSGCTLSLPGRLERTGRLWLARG